MYFLHKLIYAFAVLYTLDSQLKENEIGIYVLCATRLIPYLCSTIIV